MAIIKKIKLKMLADKNLEQYMLNIFSKDNDKEIKELVALHPNTNENILERLSKDINISVKINVAKNLNTKESILNNMIKELELVNHYNKNEIIEIIRKTNLIRNSKNIKEILFKLEEIGFIFNNKSKNNIRGC